MFKKVSTLFDYSFYRLASVYNKTDGNNSLPPIVIISLVQIFAFIDLLSILYLGLLDREERLEIFSIAKYVFIVVYLITVYLNYRKYKDKYYKYLEKWRNESRAKKIVNMTLILLLYAFIITFTGILTSVFNFS